MLYTNICIYINKCGDFMIDLLSIKDPSFIKDLSIKELQELCKAIRIFLVENISKTGGHLSSNLGVVEITVAMYYVFDPEKDKFLFDVGHQSYVHKILTGRAKDFVTLRQYGGISGYINKTESKYDIWESGHSSTSISAMSGILKSDDTDMKVVSLIGDSSIMNGVALEGLNYLGQANDKRAIIILNDNKMGISKSVGALSNAFSKLRGTAFNRGLKKVLTKILPKGIVHGFHQIKRGIKGFFQQDNIFEDMGFDYYGPYDGNDLKVIIKLLKRVKESRSPVVLHLQTIKGKGYGPSENDKVGNFHGVPPFDIETGKPLHYDENKISYSEMVSNYLVEKRKEEEFTVITPAMKEGAKLDNFAQIYPNDFIDVGIAEEHAAVMSAGIALSNKKVVLLMYSTFSQRAYDELLNDIARQNLHVIIGIDRAGIVGEDGSTHHGIYDVSMLEMMPNFIIGMPKDNQELIGMFNYAFNISSPIAIRYPRGGLIKTNVDNKYIIDNSWVELKKGNNTAIISYGNILNKIEKLIDDNKLNVGLINARFIKPIDEKLLKNIFEKYNNIIVIEDIISSGCLYHNILDFKEINQYKSKVYKRSFDSNVIIPHGSINDLYNHYGFSDNEIIDMIKGVDNND